ncbi:hypothetical protein BDV59DRAFT_197618 [Aspergillus ambiguus]|uniref:zinc finger MYND domain-containing protein n=1 Tax=Aspergillus ambiguus TaxID=176160 RepID=UPI003CCE1F77
MQRQVQFLFPATAVRSRPPVPAIQYADLKDNDSFPKFITLPRNYGTDARYYDQMNNLPPMPRKHWCLLLQLETATFSDCLVVQGHDASGYCLHVDFYTSDAGMKFLKEAGLKVGYTLAIMYPVRHGSRVAIKDDSMIRVFPSSLKQILQLNDDIQTWPSAFATHDFCHTCRTEHRRLEVCTCGVVAYCSKECQIFDLIKGGHRYDCGLLRDGDFRELMTMKWHLFNDFKRFPLR